MLEGLVSDGGAAGADDSLGAADGHLRHEPGRPAPRELRPKIRFWSIQRGQGGKGRVFGGVGGRGRGGRGGGGGRLGGRAVRRRERGLGEGDLVGGGPPGVATAVLLLLVVGVAVLVGVLALVLLGVRVVLVRLRRGEGAVRRRRRSHSWVQITPPPPKRSIFVSRVRALCKGRGSAATGGEGQRGFRRGLVEGEEEEEEETAVEEETAEEGKRPLDMAEEMIIERER